ncbi:CHAT domain-containing protein [Actinoplanes sp. HUAS TT8]|uniref:CHAT domain-containing protein n=1 Tax=Actinoplanes sp. HUAS TT8 TaxID=3447453 RepID=UPI003F525818
MEVDPVESARRLLAENPGHGFDHPPCLVRLALALRERYERTGLRGDVDEAASLIRQALTLETSTDHRRVEWLAELAATLRRRYELLGEAGDLENAIALSRTVLASTGTDHPDRSRRLSDLALALLSQQGHPGGSGLVEAIALAEEAVACAVPGTMESAGSRHNLALILHEQHLLAESPDLLNRAVRLAEEALVLCPPGPRRTLVRSQLGRLLRDRFALTGDRDDIDRAVDTAREVLDEAAGDDRHRAGYLSDLGIVLMDRHVALGGESDLSDAVVAARSAVSALPPDHRERPDYLSDLAQMLAGRHHRTGDRRDLEEALSAARDAVTAAPVDHPEAATYAADLERLAELQRSLDADVINVLVDRLDRRIEAYRNDDAAQVTSDSARAEADELDRLLRLGTGEVPLDVAAHVLGWLHLVRFIALPPDQGIADLAAAVRLFAGFYDLDVELVPQRMRRILEHGADDLSVHAAEVLRQADETQDWSRLHEAVTILRQAVAAVRPDHPDRAEYLVELADALETRFEQFGVPTDLDEAIDLSREALASTEAGHPHRAPRQTRLASALRQRFGRSAAKADIDESIVTGRAAIAEASPDDPYQATRRSLLAVALHTRFEAIGVAADLDEAITLTAGALAIRGGNDPYRVDDLSQLGLFHLQRFHDSATSSDVEVAIGALRDAVAGRAPDHPYLVRDLANLGSALHSRFERLRRRADIDEAVDVMGAALAASPSGDPELPTLLMNTAAVHSDRFEWTGEAESLDQGIDLTRKVLAALPPGHPDREACLPMLGNLLRSRFQRTTARADIDEAIAVISSALDGAGQRRPQVLALLAMALHDRFEVINNVGDLDRAVAALRESASGSADRLMATAGLAEMLHARYEAAGREADLDEAIDIGRTASRAGAWHPHRREFLSQLAGFLATRFRSLGRSIDLDEATRVARESVAHSTADDPVRPSLLANLTVILQLRADGPAGAQTPVETAGEAVRAGRSALAGAPPGHPARPMCQHNLGLALQTTFLHHGRIDDIDEAIALFDEALRELPEREPHRATVLSSLSIALQSRFGARGDSTDLDRAIAVIRIAIASTPHDHRDNIRYLGNLGTALAARFLRDRERTDIDQAIEAWRTALASGPDDLERAALWANLSGGLQTRFGATKQRADIDEAVRVGREALADAPVGHPGRARFLGNLGAALHARSVRTTASEDIDEAVRLHDEAVELVPAGHPLRPLLLSELAGALQARFAGRGDDRDLDRAVAACEAAVEATSDGHPSGSTRRFNLGSILETRYGRTHQATDLRKALNEWRQTVADPVAPAWLRINAAARWGTAAAARQDWIEATHGFEGAVRLLPVLASRRTSRTTREGLIADWFGLAADAAACAVASGRPEKAVSLLEQGRGVLWSQLLDSRTDLGELRRAAPDLAAALQRIGAALDGPTEQLKDATPVIDNRMALAQEWDQLIARVRALPGFEHFQQPPAVAALLPVNDEETAVILNVSRLRCDALIVERSGVRTCPLPDLTLPEAADRTARYLRVLQEVEVASDAHAVAAETAARSGSTADLQALQRAERVFLEKDHESEQTLTGLLGWLWQAVAEPVLSYLGFSGIPAPGTKWPRLWWCPTGPLTLLPIHAAGHHGDASAAAVIDRVVSSYTPTLRALAQAREPLSAPMVADRMLVVTQADTPGQRDLKGVVGDLAMIRELLPDRRTEIQGTAATRDRVLAELTRHRWVHFSCHGTQDLVDPSRGGLILHDGIMTIPDVAAGRFHVDYTGIAACKTATGGVPLLDESVTLAAALHFTGHRHVVATLWSVYDTIGTTDLFRDVYCRMTTGGALRPERCAGALHEAVRKLRHAHPGEPSVWTPFIHTGP